MSFREIDVEFLQLLAKKVFDKIIPLIGTEKGARKIQKGAGGDISLEIDIVAEQTIIKTLEESNVNVLLLSEEVGEQYIGDKEIINQTGAKIIIDPIDGSTNASRAIPFFSVSIAYAKGSNLEDIEKAVIMDLNTRDIYWAEKGKGAFVNGTKISVSSKDLSDQLIFEIDFYLWNMGKKLKNIKTILKKIYRLRVMGSIALSFCLLARGCIDGYIDLRRGTRLVDIAASYLILKEAGGKIFTIKGKELNQELSMDLKYPIVACNAMLETFLKEEIEKIN